MIGRRTLLAWTVAIVLLVPVGFAVADPNDAALVEFDESPEALVLSLTDAPGELAEPAGATTVRVYGNGRVEVHHPPYMKRAGDYTLVLDRDELRGLVRSVAGRGLVEFDPAAIRASKRRAIQERRGSRAASAQVLPQVDSDGTLSHFELRLKRYRRADGMPLQKDVRKQIRWQGLRADARNHAEIGALGELEAARQALRALARRTDLERRR